MRAGGRVSKAQSSPADYWNERALRFGHDLKTLAYGSKATQERKFDVLLSAIPERRVTLLDIGCGFADLYTHMRARGYDITYTGVDIAAEIVALARAAHPELRILAGDVLGGDLIAGERFEYVVSTGINCAVNGHNEAIERALLRTAFDRSTRAAIIALQSSVYLQSHPEAAADGTSWFSDPTALCDYALKNITPWVALRHDYMPHDFTLFLFREPRLA